MKRFLICLLVCSMICLCGCQNSSAPSATQAPTESAAIPTQVTEVEPESTETEATVPAEPEPTEEITTVAPVETGWFEENGTRYYRPEDGSLAKGAVVIDGVTHHFTSTGAYVVVVNPWNPVPESYTLQLQELSTAVSVAGCYVDASCYDAMTQMITDCNLYSGANVCVVSAYRSVELQTENFNNKINKLMNNGLDYETAYAQAATVIAVPGTSEHHLGLAADIVDTENWGLVQEQESLTGQKWLMANCWKYGFILRYPANTQSITGIIYEPWHYRYVGVALATELYESGLTVEEYMANLTN